MLVIRWYRLGLELLVCHPATPVPTWAEFLGVTVADEAALRLMGHVLVRWRESLGAA